MSVSFELQMGRRNILWIVTTQWRGQATGYAGDSNARTPHLDALAATSVNYSQAVTPHPMGPFARAGLLTGVPSPANGVREYFDPLPANARTVAHDFTDRGYATAFFGKWHLGQRDRSVPLVGEAHAKIIVPPAQRGGFAFWEGFESGFLLNDPWLHGTALPEPTPFPGYQSDVLVDRFRLWRERRGKDQPIFAVVSLEAPHPPYDAPAGRARAHDPNKIVLAPNVPRGGEIETKARRELSGYYAHIAATDCAIGRLLETAGDDWIVVFTSVHGDMHGAHGFFRKGWPYEESVRVPLLVRASAVAPRADASAVSLLDLRSMSVGWAEGDLSPPPPRRWATLSMPDGVALPQQCPRAWRGLRTNARKLILNGDGSPWLFFDLARDPFEEKNLVDDPAAQGEIAELKKRL